MCFGTLSLLGYIQCGVVITRQNRWALRLYVIANDITETIYTGYENSVAILRLQMVGYYWEQDEFLDRMYVCKWLIQCSDPGRHWWNGNAGDCIVEMFHKEQHTHRQDYFVFDQRSGKLIARKCTRCWLFAGSWWRHQMGEFFRVTRYLCREFTGHDVIVMITLNGLLDLIASNEPICPLLRGNLSVLVLFVSTRNAIMALC